MDDLKRQKMTGRPVTHEYVLEQLELCKFCELPRMPSVLPDKYFHEDFCWRLRAPGSSLEAADLRECLERVFARLKASQEALKAMEKPVDQGCTQPGSGGFHEGSPCIFCGWRSATED